MRSVDTEAKLLANAAGPEKQVTLLFSAISLVAGIILAYNALLLASDERRRFIVYLIEAGTPDSMIIASLIFDAFVLGVAGACIGLLAGDIVSLVAYRTIPDTSRPRLRSAASASLDGHRSDRVQRRNDRRLCGSDIACLAALDRCRAAQRRKSTIAHTPAALLRHRDLQSGHCSLPSDSRVHRPVTTIVALVTFTAGLMICLPLIFGHHPFAQHLAADHTHRQSFRWPSSDAPDTVRHAAGDGGRRGVFDGLDQRLSS